MMRWIVLLAALMAGAGIFYAALFTELTVHLVVATLLGVFLSVLLGSGLFALAFFSDKSGHDDLAAARKKATPPADRKAS